jgi:hypothetical protein
VGTLLGRNADAAALVIRTDAAAFEGQAAAAFEGRADAVFVADDDASAASDALLATAALVRRAAADDDMHVTDALVAADADDAAAAADNKLVADADAAASYSSSSDADADALVVIEKNIPKLYYNQSAAIIYSMVFFKLMAYVQPWYMYVYTYVRTIPYHTTPSIYMSCLVVH